MNYFQLTSYGVEFAGSVYRQSMFIKKFLKPLIIKHCEGLGYHLNASERKKVLYYYPMYTILACAQMYLALKGRRLTTIERKRLTLVSSMATICDDLIDEELWTREQIFRLLANDLNEERLTTKAKLLVALNKEFYLLDIPARYLPQLKLALEWQAASVKQLDTEISLDEIVHVCREKNGHTSLMFASLIDEDWTEAERKFIYQSAIVGQLTNDSFDMYVDSKNNLHTYINTASSIANARKFFVDECRKLHQYVMQCDDDLRHKKACIRRMSCMHAYALVAFDHLRETENKYGLPIDWKKPIRQEMVTDMAMIKNQLKLVKYMRWLSKQ